MPQKKKASTKTAAAKLVVTRKGQKPVVKSAKAASKSVKASAKVAVKTPLKHSAAKSTAKTLSKSTAKASAKKVVVAVTKSATKLIAPKPAKSDIKKSTASKAAPIAAKAPIIVKPMVVKPTAVKPVVAKAPALPPAHVLPVTAAAPVVARNVPAAVAKPAAQRITAPMIAPKDAAAKALELQRHQQMNAAKKPVSARHGFKTNEFIVYPAHGVGRIVGIEEQEIAGMALELFVITFEKDKMTLRVPTGKLQSVGMRKLADETIVKRAMETLKGRARIKRTMWSRRAQEYEAKINSGDLISIAEVVRDLYRSETQPEQSYSERQLYEAALDRMAREIAAVDKLDERGAVQKITEVLSRSAKGRRAAEEAVAEVEADDGDDEVQAA